MGVGRQGNYLYRCTIHVTKNQKKVNIVTPPTDIIIVIFYVQYLIIPTRLDTGATRRAKVPRCHKKTKTKIKGTPRSHGRAGVNMRWLFFPFSFADPHAPPPHPCLKAGRKRQKRPTSGTSAPHYSSHKFHSFQTERVPPKFR